MKKNKLKKNAVMTVCIIGACFATSCTSDEFYGIQEKTESLDFPTLSKIARSKEFIEYQKQAFLNIEIINSIDNTKKEVVDFFQGKPVYAIGNVLSIRPYLDARKKLLEEYPEFIKITDEDKNQILSLAILNNKSLRQLAEKYIPNTDVNKRTKAINYESYAVKYVKAGTGEYQMRDTRDGGEWLVAGFVTWYTRDSFQSVLDMAIDKTNSTENEHGGYHFADGSGTLNDDPTATPDSMTFIFWPTVQEDYTPTFDFHVHPNDNLDYSLYDALMWDSMPWDFHFIYDTNGDLQPYEL